MKYILFLTTILFSCSSTQSLPSGMWSGYQSPMNQPERQMLLNYRVNHLQEKVSLEIFGPGGVNIPTKDLKLTEDTLYFSFKKVEKQEMVSCALQKIGKNSYYGRCTDPDGKWALFSMQYNPQKFRHFIGIRCACHG